MKKYKGRILAFALMVLLAMTSCGSSADIEEDSDISYITKKGNLVVGVTVFEPMDYLDSDGEWTGFDAACARKLAKELGVEPMCCS